MASSAAQQQQTASSASAYVSLGSAEEEQPLALCADPPDTEGPEGPEGGGAAVALQVSPALPLEEEGCPPWNLPSVRSAPNALKLHAMAAVVLSAASMVGTGQGRACVRRLTGVRAVWLVVGIYVSALPWFMYVMGGATLSLATHYYAFVRRPREWVQLHVVTFIVLSSEGLLTWLHTRATSLWLIYAALILTIPLSVHLIYHMFRLKPHKWLYAHFAVFAIVSVICFIGWLDMGGTGFPWWMYVVLGLLPSLFVHYAVVHHLSLLALHGSLFTLGNLTVFFTWVWIGSRFPWWIFVFAAWGFILYLHYNHYKACEEAVHNVHVPQPITRLILVVKSGASGAHGEAREPLVPNKQRGDGIVTESEDDEDEDEDEDDEEGDREGDAGERQHLEEQRPLQQQQQQRQQQRDGESNVTASALDNARELHEQEQKEATAEQQSTREGTDAHK
eukprot:m51a1_g10216 hypothetical protein (448) ;mRNA; f:109365-111570